MRFYKTFSRRTRETTQKCVHRVETGCFVNNVFSKIASTCGSIFRLINSSFCARCQCATYRLLLLVLSVSLHFQLLYQTIIIKYILARNVTNTKCIRSPSQREIVCIRIITMFSCNLGQKNTFKGLKKQLNKLHKPRVLKFISVYFFSNCTKKKLWLLIIDRKKIKRKVMIIVQRTHI